MRFEVHIGAMSRTVESPVDPHKPVPEIPDVYCVVEADDQQEAVEAAWIAWDQKHGPGQRPNGHIVKVKPLEDR